MYGKLFLSMYDGSLVNASDPTRWHALVTFQQLVILGWPDGVVDVTVDAIHRRTGIPIDVLQDGVRQLELPDPDSRTPDLEGRRIVRLDEHRTWGWEIVNYMHYRELVSREDRRRMEREKKARARAKAKAAAGASPDVPACPPVSPDVPKSPDSKSKSKSKSKDLSQDPTLYSGPGAPKAQGTVPPMSPAVPRPFDVDATVAWGQSMGLDPRRGESQADFHARCSRELKGRQAAQGVMP